MTENETAAPPAEGAAGGSSEEMLVEAISESL